MCSDARNHHEGTGSLMLLGVALCFVVLVSGDCPSKCHCSSYKTLCTLAKLNTVPSGLASTTELVKVALDHIPRLNNAIISHLRNLTQLELISVHLQVIEPATFKMFNRLESLAITHNNISVLHARSFQFLDNLHFLDLSYNNISILKSDAFFGLNTLRHLIINSLDNGNTNNNIYFENNAFSMENPNCDLIKTPTKLDLSSGDILEMESGMFKNLCMFTDVKLGFLDFKNAEKDAFVGLTNVTRLLVGLTHLNSSGPIKITNGFTNGLSKLTHLDMSGGDITSIERHSFNNLRFLQFLDLEFNKITKIKSGAFIGLVALKYLNLNTNPLFSLQLNMFLGLKSLEILKMSKCNINVLQPGTFIGLSKLRILDLRKNNIIIAPSTNTFFGLRMLRELKFDFIFVKLGAFKNLSFIKHLLMYHYSLYGKSTSEELARLDSVGIVGPFMPTQSLQVLRTVHLYIDADVDSPQQVIHNVLETVRYVKELTLVLGHINSSDIFREFASYQFSTLTVQNSKFEILDNKSVIYFSDVNILEIINCSIKAVKRGAFQVANSLTQLTFHQNYGMVINSHAFYGLYNLRILNLQTNKISKFDNDAFMDLETLEELDLSKNNIYFLSPRIFQNLSSIRMINLSQNRLRMILPGVFGAVCNGQFKLSCKNATSPQYCNPASALTTLQYLDLQDNDITYVHPHAFIFCTNLHTLYLSENMLLTLDNTFLYIPSLRNFGMFFCNISKIPNNTFECTPHLSEINLAHNTISKLTITPFFHLKKLKIISLFFNPLVCDCELKKTWVWFSERGIWYNPESLDYTLPIECDIKNIVLLNLECNETYHHKQFRNSTSDNNEFVFFKQYIEPIVLIILFVFGLASNGFLLYISLRHSGMRTKQNICIIHLSIVDIVCLILNLPLSYWDVVNVTWELGNAMCSIFIMAKDTMVGATVFSIVALSAERAIVAHSFNNLRNACVSDTQPTAWFLLMTWASAIVTSLPGYFFATVRTRCLSCLPGNEEYIRRVWTSQLVVYCLIPTLAITYCNIMTWYLLRKSVRKMPGEIKKNIQAKNRKIVANLVLILALVFVVSYVPSFILRVLVSWSVVNIDNVFLISFFTFCLFFCNTVFNPISIFIMSSKYKSHALSYFTFLRNEANVNVNTRYQKSQTLVSGFARNFNRHDNQTIQQARMQRFSKL